MTLNIMLKVREQVVFSPAEWSNGHIRLVRIHPQMKVGERLLSPNLNYFQPSFLRLATRKSF
jgi:hypothetical protein